MSDYRVVAPFRPFPPETGHHLALPDFDWWEAIRMLSDSVARSCGREVSVLTDIDTELPFPTLRFRTTRRRLMLWYLEIAACYLESEAFDMDTVSLDSDQLVFADLGRWFSSFSDLAILVRKPPKGGGGYPILNGVQWWAYKAKARLGPFYRTALAIAETLPEAEITWGADTVALWRLLQPLEVGLVGERAGCRVRMVDADTVIEALDRFQCRALDAGKPMRQPYRPVLDFRNTRKAYMRRAYDQTIGALV